MTSTRSLAQTGAILAFAFSPFVSAVYAADLPDLSKTPGVVRSELTQAVICNTKWGRDARHVTAAMKREVFKRYGYSGNTDPRCAPAGRRGCEVDHLIGRQLGGADVLENLWPQAYGTHPWNANRKDRLETRLRKDVCAGKITLQEARDKLVNDWTKAYQEYWGRPDVSTIGVPYPVRQYV